MTSLASLASVVMSCAGPLLVLKEGRTLGTGVDTHTLTLADLGNVGWEGDWEGEWKGITSYPRTDKVQLWLRTGV